MVIESVQNEKIKYFRKLRETKYIKEYKEFIVEGEHLVEEAIKNGYAKEIILLNGKDYNTDLNKIYVSDNVLKSISLLKTPQYIMALCNVIDNKEIKGSRLLLLDNVSDPGNLGTIIRSSVAFNIDTIILSEDSVNLYNDKVVRSSEGMMFNTNIITMNLNTAIDEIKNKGIKVYGTDLKGSKYLHEFSKPSSFALIVGNEGMGMKKEILDLCDENIKIEMNNNCESLNVGVATSIILYEWSNHE